jgi:hypothetical protein
MQYREGVNAVYRMLRAACSSSARVQESNAGAGWIPRVVRCTAVAEMVAVVGLLCEIQSTILRNFGVADIAFKELNDVRCLLG